MSQPNVPPTPQEKLAELLQGDGLYYVAQERAFAPGISGGTDAWPAVLTSPKVKHGRLVKRVLTDEDRAFLGAARGGSPAIPIHGYCRLEADGTWDHHPTLCDMGRGDSPLAAEQKLALLVAHIEALDSQLTRLGDGEWIEGYQMQTGAWHRILGLIRDAPIYRTPDPDTLAADLAAQIPAARQAEEAYRKAGEVSQAELRREVCGGSPPDDDKTAHVGAFQMRQEAMRGDSPAGEPLPNEFLAGGRLPCPDCGARNKCEHDKRRARSSSASPTGGPAEPSEAAVRAAVNAEDGTIGMERARWMLRAAFAVDRAATCSHEVGVPYCGPGCYGFGRANYERGWQFRDEEWRPPEEKLCELVRFFREEEAEWGAKGDYENWSTERAAIELIRSLREQIIKVQFSPMGDNHHNALVCPYCQERSAKAEALRAVDRAGPAPSEAIKPCAALNAEGKCVCDYKWLDPECCAKGCQSLVFKGGSAGAATEAALRVCRAVWPVFHPDSKYDGFSHWPSAIRLRAAVESALASAPPPEQAEPRNEEGR